jgi:hypothetical protein
MAREVALRRHARGCRFRIPVVPSVDLMLAALDSEHCAHCAYLRSKLPQTRSSVSMVRRVAVA